MPLFPFRFRPALSLVCPLSSVLCLTGAAARAAEKVQTAAGSVATPSLSLGARPASSISASRRPKISATRASSGLSLLMALPAAAQVTTPAPATAPPVVSAKETPLPDASASGVILSGQSIPQTLISPPRRVKVAAKSRFVASRVASRAELETIAFKAPAIASVSTSVPTPVAAISAVPAPVVAAPFAPRSAAGALVANAQIPAVVSPRDRMARLPSRGGPVRNRGLVEMQPAAPQTAPISDSQRLLLAQLDADLGRAQRRLDRAETRLTEGQRQLGSFTGVLRSAMFDTGDDGRGLHPFVRVAQRYMGTPYVWGGESALGFDCSGFIMRVMRDLGYRALPHSAAEQFNYGTPIARELLKPGDIVFFANTYKPGVSHVGIYLGKSRFIHAANSKVGTIVSSLNDPKWVAHYAGARRLIRVKAQA